MRRLSRRLVRASLAVATEATRAEAQEEDALREAPGSGASRPGPMGPPPARPRVARGVAPVQIRIDRAAVDAPFEQVDIVDGVTQDPSGPWAVSWYDDLGALGERGNAVMAGHVDYWDVGPAVFWNLNRVAAGDELRVVAEDGRAFADAQRRTKNYVVADMTPADFDEVFGDAGEEALTPITCAVGTFAEASQGYRERTVRRVIAAA